MAAVLGGAEQAYQRLTTYRAQFTQTIDNPMLGAAERSRGTMFLQPPNRFAMRFREPGGDRIVADGTWLWLYAPSSTPGQVIRQPIPATGTSTPNFFAQFLERPLERYTATLLPADVVEGEPVDVVRLVPRGESLGFREAVIALARRDSLPRRLSLMEESGQRRVIVMSRSAVNQTIPAAELAFTPPKGTRVVTP